MLQLPLGRNCWRMAPALQRSYTRAYASNASSNRHNDAIIDLLKQHLQEENQSHTRNLYKVRAFASAIKAIDQLDHPLRSPAEAKALKGVGPGILKRIKAFLSEPEHVQAVPPDKVPQTPLDSIRNQAIFELQLVQGLGPKKALEFVNAGCMSIADLRQSQHIDKLTPTMRIGLQYFEHLREPVVREQAETTLDFVRGHLSAKFDVFLVGSYRRGLPASSDIDIVLFHPSYVHVPTPDHTGPPMASSRRGRHSIPLYNSHPSVDARASSLLLQDVVRPLEDRGLLAATFSSGLRRWRGVVRLPERTGQGSWEERSHRVLQIRRTEGLYRQMDINLAPMKSKGAALLALTGDMEFTRHVRSRALELGMHLNEFGLWRWKTEGNVSGDGDAVREDGGFWELVRTENEEDILTELGMDYIEPERRNFGFVVGRDAHGSGRRRRRKIIES